MIIQIQGLRQELSQSEIFDMIEPEILEEIKRSDPHPELFAYSLIHEGIAKPKLLGTTNQEPITFTRKAIQSLKNIILKGIRLFKGGHGQDNSTIGRQAIGEIIGSGERMINNKLHHVIVVFGDKNQLKNNPVISLEGSWNLIKETGKLIADSVEAITGIAAADNEYSPAFNESGLLQTVQAMSFDDEVEGRETLIESLTGLVQKNYEEKTSNNEVDYTLAKNNILLDSDYDPYNN